VLTGELPLEVIEMVGQQVEGTYLKRYGSETQRQLMFRLALNRQNDRRHRRRQRQQREQQQGQQQELERTEAESSAAAVVTLAQHTFDSALAGAIASAQRKKTGF
jgi:hypothetical protein